MYPRKFFFAALIGLLAMEHTGQASEYVAVQLIYQLSSEAERCPTREGIIDAVSARMGYRPFKDDASRKILVDIKKKGASLRARVEMRDAEERLLGKRELSSSQHDCRELAGAVELAICIAIDPLSLGRTPISPPASQPERQRNPDPAVNLPPVVKTPAPIPPQPTPPGNFGVSASLGALLALGSAPSAAAGINLQARIRWRNLSAGFEGRVDFPSYKEVPGGQISSSLITGMLLPCMHYGPLHGCVLVSGGAMRAAGHELVQAKSDTLPYFAGGLRAGAELPLTSRWALRATADLIASFTRISLKESETGHSLWTSPVVSGAFSLAAVVHFL